MPPRVVIDGHAGTTGLRIRDWLRDRSDLELATLDDERRKQPEARRELLRSADLAVFCLPDAAAREAAGWLADTDVRVIDASTAYRVSEGWVYGLPELDPGARERISGAARVSNPGCYASAVALAVRPLVDEGLLSADAPISVRALSGYSGGGRGMIEKWEDPDDGLLTLPHDAPYALEREHKHIPEMQRYSGLAGAPQFVPAVGPFRCGMRVEVPLHASSLARGASAKSIWETLDARYAGERFVRVMPYADPFEHDERSLDPRRCNDTNRLELAVVPNLAGHVLLVALLDNLGKGAAGVAIQSLNLMLGLPEERGLAA